VTPAPVTPPVAVPVPPPVVVPDRPVVPEVFWGRWQSVAGYPDAPGRVGDSGMISPSFVGMYAITRVADSQLVMPKEGSASFKLADSEAMVQKPGGVNRIGKAESGTLDVNFVDRTFATALTIKADTDSFDIAGKGAITEKGAIVSNPDSSTLIRGFLGGPAAEQAGYIFRNVTVSGTSITGATSWTR
jgi:hypothetical protein